MLFPPLVNQKMLPETSYTLDDGREIQISLATALDSEDIIAIQEACYGGKAPWGRIAVNNELRNKMSSFFLMCHHDDRAIAFIGLSKRHQSLHVTNIATRPEYQKQGIASFLIGAVIAITQKLEKKRVTLEVRMSNVTAQSLYRTLGFEDGQIKRNYYHNNGEDALDMIYLIDETDEKNEV